MTRRGGMLTPLAMTASLVLVGASPAAGQGCDPPQIHKLLPGDGEEFDDFGKSVAISGETAIVGAFRDDDNGRDSGSAYLFDVATGE